MKQAGKNFVSAVILILIPAYLAAQLFKHPGLDQTADDLAYMKSQVLAWNQPWKDAFDNLKRSVDLNTQVIPFAYVLYGADGNPDSGAGAVKKNADLSYNCALIWYITGEKNYAAKAIEILNAWSLTLKGFDYEDAKLAAGQSAYLFCNAAEILRYTGSGWAQRDIDRFTGMLYKVYFPLLRQYSPQSGGSSEAVIIQALISIAVFSDNAQLFNNAVNHLLHGSSNGSLLRYIYPSGECHESKTGIAKVKSGLSAFAGSARIAHSQGIDLYKAGGNRIALGYEYTSRQLLAENSGTYTGIAGGNGDFDDIFEHLYRYYKSKGTILPFTAQAADSARRHATRSLLTATRAASLQVTTESNRIGVNTISDQAGPVSVVAKTSTGDELIAEPGMLIQDLLDSAAITGRKVLIKKGIHKLRRPLKLRSGLIIAGEGTESIITLEPGSGERAVITNNGESISDVTISDLQLDGTLYNNESIALKGSSSTATSVGFGGIVIRCNSGSIVSGIKITNVTVHNCLLTGIIIQGAREIRISNCNFSENGSGFSPAGLQHNIDITGSSDVIINQTRLNASPMGCGVTVSGSRKVTISGCEIARNGRYGIHLSESEDIAVAGNLIEASTRNGIMAEYLYNGCSNLNIAGNQVQYNGSFAIETYAVKRLVQSENTMEGNGRTEAQVKISEQKELQLE
jgi:parallel beta-helix repeat protein